MLHMEPLVAHITEDVVQCVPKEHFDVEVRGAIVDDERACIINGRLEGQVGTIPAEVGIPALVLKKYDETSPDVVCLDLTLDDSLVPAGITLLDEIRKRNPRAKVIIISALEQKEITDQALKLGAKAYITKPFDKMEVAATIKRVAG